MMRQAKVSIDKFNNITSEEVCQMLLCTQRHWTIWFKDNGYKKKEEKNIVIR